MGKSENHENLDEFSNFMKELFVISTNLRVKRITTHEVKQDKIDQSLTPNFIQSLDAGHMRNSVNSMAREGIKDFWSVHDSFGTHACNIETMKKIVGKEFAKLHKDRDIEYWCRHMLEEWDIIRDTELMIPIDDIDFDKVAESEFIIG